MSFHGRTIFLDRAWNSNYVIFEASSINTKSVNNISLLLLLLTIYALLRVQKCPRQVAVPLKRSVSASKTGPSDGASYLISWCLC